MFVNIKPMHCLAVIPSACKTCGGNVELEESDTQFALLQPGRVALRRVAPLAGVSTVCAPVWCMRAHSNGRACPGRARTVELPQTLPTDTHWQAGLEQPGSQLRRVRAHGPTPAGNLFRKRRKPVVAILFVE